MNQLSTEERFWGKVDKTGDCWTWTAKHNGAGYGRIWVDGKLHRSHRFAYEMLVGPIPEGHDIDHACRNRSCVNPAHLRPSTRKQNAENLSTVNPATLSGIRGVNYSTKTGKWRARVRHNYQYFELGHYDSISEAEAVVVAKRNELHTHNVLDRIAVQEAA